MQAVNRLKDGPVDRWHPASISDRKLAEFRLRLVKIQRLGGPFTEVGFSSQAQRRLASIRDHDRTG